MFETKINPQCFYPMIPKPLANKLHVILAILLGSVNVSFSWTVYSSNAKQIFDLNLEDFVRLLNFRWNRTYGLHIFNLAKDLKNRHHFSWTNYTNYLLVHSWQIILFSWFSVTVSKKIKMSVTIIKVYCCVSFNDNPEQISITLRTDFFWQ